MNKPVQRTSAESNAQVGRDFEEMARQWFLERSIELERDFPVAIGAGDTKKERKFDLGSESPAALIECKAHRWTAGNKVPSAKMSVWNESMYYFHLAPDRYRKILFVLEDRSRDRNETLAEYYVRTYNHLIPEKVEILEYSIRDRACRIISLKNLEKP